MNKTLLLSMLLSATILSITSCKKDDPDPINEEEVITTLTYTLTSPGGTSVVLNFVDLDGDGANAPVITGGTLEANQTYTGRIELLNESETPAEDITTEIQEEDEDHQFFFESDLSGVTVAYTDTDADGNPVGLNTTLTTADAGSGNLKITLHHEPDKSADGVANGDITNSNGETDIEVTFPIDVQ